MARYKSPTGSPIIGTAETVLVTASISGIDENGQPQYAGESEIHWDTQESIMRAGSVVYVDENAAEWRFDQLEKIEEDENA